MSRLRRASETWMRLVLFMGFLSVMPQAIGNHGLPLSLGAGPVEFKPLQLDAADQQWLANHGALRVGIALGDHEPVDITNDRNQYQGLSADYLSIVRDKLGATVEVLGFRKRDQAVAELLAGKIDILTSASGFERGVEGITFSQEYMTDRLVLVGRAGEAKPVTG